MTYSKDDDLAQMWRVDGEPLSDGERHMIGLDVPRSSDVNDDLVTALIVNAVMVHDRSKSFTQKHARHLREIAQVLRGGK